MSEDSQHHDPSEPPPSEDAPHSCQPPQDHLPEPGATWSCPECGRTWLLEDISDDSGKGGPGQRMNWTPEGRPPPPKASPPPVRLPEDWTSGAT